MPGGVRNRLPWLYLSADWAASDILVPEREAESGGRGQGGHERRSECKGRGERSGGVGGAEARIAKGNRG